MARFGTWAPLAADWAAQPRLTTPDIICVHTMVGSLAGTDAMFRRNGYGGTFSHFGIGGDGACTQWQDTDYRAAANYNGNHRIISVECADIGAPFAAWNTNDGGAVPAFSDAQLDTLARLIATVAPAHNIPIVLIPDALPGRRGIGYHRLGVPGYMVVGAEQWSTATGKVCPGNRRIAQIPQVIAAALGGDDDMPYISWPAADKNQLCQDVANAIVNRPVVGTPGGPDAIALWLALNQVHSKVVRETYDLSGRPVDRKDDLLGHVLSTEARVRALADKQTPTPTPAPVSVDPAALAAALLADEASVAKLGDAIAAGLAKRVGNG